MALGEAPSSETDSRYDWRAANNEILSQLDKKVTRWKKILGTINPYSWVATR
jgi:hypothetical protein